MPLRAAGRAAALWLPAFSGERRRNLCPRRSALPGYTLARARGKSHLAWFSSQCWSFRSLVQAEGLLFHSCKHLPNAGTSQISNPEGTTVSFLYRAGSPTFWLNVTSALLLFTSHLHSTTVPWTGHTGASLGSPVLRGTFKANFRKRLHRKHLRMGSPARRDSEGMLTPPLAPCRGALWAWCCSASHFNALCVPTCTWCTTELGSQRREFIH